MFTCRLGVFLIVPTYGRRVNSNNVLSLHLHRCRVGLERCIQCNRTLSADILRAILRLHFVGSEVTHEVTFARQFIKSQRCMTVTVSVYCCVEEKLFACISKKDFCNVSNQSSQSIRSSPQIWKLSTNFYNNHLR